MNLEIPKKADEIRKTLDTIDTIIDDLNSTESSKLEEVYTSINIILKAQYTLLKKPKLHLIKE